MTAATNSPATPGRRFPRVVATVALVAGMAFAALMLVPAALGLQQFVITGGSMTGSYDRGSVVFSQLTDADDLRRGDVITFVPPGRHTKQGDLTHRIVSVRRDEAGVHIFRTKGDANPTPDPWRFRVDGTRVSRAAFHVPYAGYVLSALSVRAVRVAVIGLPALLVAFFLLQGLWREAGEEARRREQAEDLEAATS